MDFAATMISNCLWYLLNILGIRTHRPEGLE